VSASKREVRNFGLLFAGIGLLVTLYLVYVGNEGWVWSLIGAVFFLGTGVVAYRVLRPFYVAWMKFAFVLGWVNTRVLLGIFFYAIITPMGIVLRLIGKDLLDQRIDRSKDTYWKVREKKPFDPKRYERLF